MSEHSGRAVAAKFGGTSVKDAERIRSVAEIVLADPRRRLIVVSAPAGVTAELIRWCDSGPRARAKIWRGLRERFARIALELGVEVSVPTLFDMTERRMRGIRSPSRLRHFVLSRGEWLNAQIVAAVLGFEFTDAATFIAFDTRGRFDFRATRAQARSLRLGERCGIVVPGFYGASAGGRIYTFSRGGSDITGAIVAALVGADEYENWTDVDGVYAADPRIVQNPRKNEVMTYKELRELSFMGAKVFHEDAVAFARNAGIPIHVRSTLAPHNSGTRIQTSARAGSACRVTGVAGKNGFSMLTMEKYGMDEETGILARAAGVFTDLGIGINVSSSIDSLTFIAETAKLKPLERKIRGMLRKHFAPDDIRVEHDVALICTVGEGMRHTPGISAMVDAALANEQINILLELQGGSEINIIRGVKEKDAHSAIRAIYRTFFTT